jgi:uncharacterized protein YecE (DUF72 family)
MAEIRVGTSGWNYPTGRGSWNGVFYPARRARGFDELAYYAERFDTVEVNSTFYRVPDPNLTQRWLKRTPPQFLFSVKLYQKFTHPDMYLARDGVTDWNLSLGDFDEFRRGLDPVARAGRLAALLVQFPASFRASAETRGYLDWLLGAFAEYPLAVELRHRTWSDTGDDTSAQLSAHGATWVLIDEPKFRDSIDQTESGVPGFRGSGVPGFGGSGVRPEVKRASEPASAGLLYLRLHGRHAAAWWDHAESEDRYDYLYSPAELMPFAATAREAAAAGRRVLMYMNNHFSAKSVANAAILKHALGQDVRGDFPREMIDRYPDLSGIVRTPGLL